MNRAATYAELLLDPRWQRRRLEVFQRDGWRCRCCRTATRQLHAHHIAYLKGLAPWEYEEHWLISLCDRCHVNEHRFGDAFWAELRVHAVQRSLCGPANMYLIGAGASDPNVRRVLEEIVDIAAQYGWDELASVIENIGLMCDDREQDRKDAMRGAGLAAAMPMTDTARQWARDYEAAEDRE